MRHVIATSRCEVDGEVRLPGDKFNVTEEQFVYLTSHNAVVESTLQSARSADEIIKPANITDASVHGDYANKIAARRTGK